MAINVSRITFTDNDPIYGVFLAGDIIDTYWEPTTLQFSVQRNGVDYPQVGASRIHTSQKEVNTGQLYYRNITILVPEYCVGTTLYTFTTTPQVADINGGYSDWPYCHFLETPNSNMCSVTPVVQDIAWVGLPSVTHATNNTSADGSFSYQATSSYGPIYYSLAAIGYGLGFDYTSGVFTNLGVGGYTVRARDAKGFIIGYSFQIIDLSEGRRPPPLQVCDLMFIGTAALSQDTGPGDGSITFAASSSRPILYALRDFFYYDLTGQASPTFSNLRAGTYTLYAVDDKNCKANYPFVIPLLSAPSPSPATPPTQNIVYQMGVTDYNGKQSIVNIVNATYNSAITQVDGGSDDPIVYSLRLDGESNVFSPIHATQLRLTLQSTTPFQFSPLFTNSEDYRVYYYKEGQLKFCGKIYPQAYKEPYTESVKYPVTFVATDGLVELDDVDFLDDNGNRYAGVLKEIQVIALALSKLGFGLNIRSACNIYDVGMAQTAADDPLAQAYVDCNAYYPKNETLSCMEVIKRILEPYTASIIQYGGYWWIVRFEECVTTSVPYREFDYNGVYFANSTFNPLADVKRTTAYDRLAWLDGAYLDMTTGYGNIEVLFKQGLRKSLIKNSGFDIVKKYSVQQGTSQTVDVSGFNLVINGDDKVNTNFTWVDDEQTNAAMILQGTGLCYITTTVPSFKLGGNDKLSVLLKYKIEDSAVKFSYQRVKMMVKFGSYYLLADGTWSTTESILITYATDGGAFNDIKIKSTSTPTGGIYTGDLTIRVYSSYVRDAEFTSFDNLRNNKATTNLPIGYRTEVFYLGASTSIIDDAMYYYELENNTSGAYYPLTIAPDITHGPLTPGTAGTVDIVRPFDYNSGSNPLQWVLKNKRNRYANMPEVGQLQIDELRVQYSPAGAELTEDQSISLSPTTTKRKKTITLYHGSAVKSIKTIFSTGFNWSTGPGTLTEGHAVNNNATLTHTNFVRSSGGASWDNWKRDAVNEKTTLQEVALKSISAQLKTPSRRISGGLSNRPVAGNPIYLWPISVLKENYDNKIYKPMGFSYHDRQCMYDGEFIQMTDITSGGTTTNGAVGTFNATFNSTFR